MTANMMPIEQQKFIYGIQNWMLKHFVMDKSDAWDFGYLVYESKEFLLDYLREESESHETNRR